MSDDSVVVLHCPGQKFDDKGDDLLLIDDVVMGPLSDEHVSKHSDLDVTDKCATVLGPSVECLSQGPTPAIIRVDGSRWGTGCPRRTWRHCRGNSSMIIFACSVLWDIDLYCGCVACIILKPQS